MERVTKIEEFAASWYEKLPHLPESARTWLADNCWWMVLISVIIGGLSVIGVLSMSLLAGLLLAGIAGVAGVAAGGFIILFVLLWLALAVLSVILLALAINPLKRKEKKGWTLVFMVALVNVAAVAVKVIFDFEIASFVFGLIGSAIAGYFLFEIRNRFVAVTVVTPVAKTDQQAS